jgi:hypothetical protein
MTSKKISELPEAALPLVGTEAVPVVQDGITKQTAVTNLAGDAAILTWMAPYRVTPEGDPKANLAAINQAILEATGKSRPSMVMLPRGRIPVDGPVILRRGVRVHGASAGDLPAGTELFLVDGANTNLVQNDEWPSGDQFWQWGEIANLRLNGNSPGNPEGGSGVAVRQMGEAAEIRNVVAKNCTRFGFEFSGRHAPLMVRSCAAHGNLKGGVRLAAEGAMVLTGISGEGNGTFLVIDGGGAPSITIIGLSAQGHDVLIRLKEGSGQLSILGGCVVAQDGGMEVIRISGGAPRVYCLGLRHTGYPRLLRDEVTGFQLPSDGEASGVVFYNAEVRAAGGPGAGWRLNTGGQTGAAEPRIASGAGAPADELALPNGSLYLRTDGERGSTLYLREGGTWVPR